MFRQLIEYLRERRVLILGFGREGRSTYDMIRRHLPDKHLGIGDRRDIDLHDSNVTLYGLLLRRDEGLRPRYQNSGHFVP